MEYYIVDVFTSEKFNGAQIGVFPDAGNLSDADMQLLAREINLSDCVFLSDKTGVAGGKRLRAFTPSKEINFAGPPIIASAHVLAETGAVKLKDKYTDFTLEQNSGVIEISITGQDGKPGLIQYKLDANPTIDRYVPVNADLAAMLGLQEADIEKLKYQPLLVSTEQTWLIVPLRSFDAVRKATFDYSVWSQSIAPVCMANEILLFSTQSDHPASNFHARLVGPDIGIHEDPPIATTMSAFTGYLCEQKHVSEGTHAFIIDRGLNTTRKSVLTIEMVNRKTGTNVVRVGGTAVIVGKGSMYLG